MPPRLLLAAALILSSSQATMGQTTTTPPVPTEDSHDRILYLDETERPVPLIKKEVRNILLDQKDIWTSPFRVKKSNAGWWILFTGATAGLIAVDYRLSRQLPNTLDQRTVSRNLSNMGATYSVLPVAAGFYAIGALAHDSHARETGVLSLEALADSAILVEVLKAVSSRERPLDGMGHGRFFQWGHDSFPSGHSISSFTLASVIAHEYGSSHKWVPFVAYGLASVVAVTRFSGQEHFASDVVAGSGAGYFIGRYVYNTHDEHKAHRRHALSDLKTSIRPVVDPMTRSYAIRWQIAE